MLLLHPVLSAASRRRCCRRGRGGRVPLRYARRWWRVLADHPSYTCRVPCVCVCVHGLTSSIYNSNNEGVKSKEEEEKEKRRSRRRGRGEGGRGRKKKQEGRNKCVCACCARARAGRRERGREKILRTHARTHIRPSIRLSRCRRPDTAAALAPSTPSARSSRSCTAVSRMR